MPKDTSIQSILVIGSGPIVIGQAAEFDYAGTQGCSALKEEGYEVILVNNNPATIMSDQAFADRVYFEPLTVDSLEKIIELERPDGILATLGGQTGLNLAYQLSEAGILERFQVKFLGSSIETIKKAEDREIFRALMKELNEPVPESEIIRDVETARRFGQMIGFPIIVRPAYTLGGTGGGIANHLAELEALVKGGLNESAINQCLIEKSIAGYKEIEFEVVRDSTDTCIIICNMENIDPVGIHTGDSIVVAPSQTLTNDEYQLLRQAAVKIVSKLGIIGGCNIQFALDPTSRNYYLIEVNPRVSRSSALASKATGYPIAQIAAKLAVGYSLSELYHPLTKHKSSSFEPVIDYVVVKFPKWAFNKFPAADRRLGTQMKATGEAMGMDRNLERALLKAIHSLDGGTDLKKTYLIEAATDHLEQMLTEQTDERFFIIMELLRRGQRVETLFEMTKIDRFFLQSFKKLVNLEQQVAAQTFETITKSKLQMFKEKGISDQYLANEWHVTERAIRNKRKMLGIKPIYKMVDTCAGEFEAYSNYFYSSYFGETELNVRKDKRKVLIIGSGPIRIGQGIEFDYCSVQAVFALKKAMVETIMINNNPETVSTDYKIADRLYFEPLILEDVLNVIEAEGITEVLIQFGGQTALNLAEKLEEYGLTLLGITSNKINQLEDRKQFYQLLDDLTIPHMDGEIVQSEKELSTAVKKMGFPVLIRPSFVIGGKGMEIISCKTELERYIQKNRIYPVLADRFLQGMEAEFDLAADGQHMYVPAIIEHIERTGVHSGDSVSVIPPQSLTSDVQEKMIGYARLIVQKLQYKGLMNIQFIINKEKVYVLEVNPRASRTVPIISKVTDVPLVEIATKVLLGKYHLSNDVIAHHSNNDFVCVKYPVFSTYALKGLDSKVGPEMKSTGEGIAIASTFEEAMKKAFQNDRLKKIVQWRIGIKGNGNDKRLKLLAEAAGVKLIDIEDHYSIQQMKEMIALFSPNESFVDRKLREEAIKNRIITFTERETLEVFLQGLAVEEWSVRSMGDWLDRVKKTKEVSIR
ncbi:carbamoyl-phosphate synthase large subunit [Cytobacillus eiseniae]|uniref:carbamoyl-phosphate synthase (ammonia) n=1 Tax=Cytobacillus eiseniae TaxID=762947 RepID=A0ABS4RE22_9BACI|nr:carbamoyl phosphate synthase large subunit [Cytobacillus eiseniae]MBP2241150.1 carbamoyl-phosphate synthase large subunit [Cytobacillus eiseniae]